MPPSNIFDLIKLLHEPAEKWGVAGVENFISGDSAF